MHHDFWHQKWESNQIGFHLADANPLLLKHCSSLSLAKNARVFVPLCGKSLDIAWLLAQGYQVVGIELSQIAVDALFAQLQITPNITQSGNLIRYQAEHIDLFVGDIFALDQTQLGHVDAIYDRAAFIALPDKMRQQYSQQIMQLSHHAPQLLVTLSYDQDLHAGPPFSITEQMIASHYAHDYTIELLASETKPDGLKGKHPATEQVWLLKP